MLSLTIRDVSSITELAILTCVKHENVERALSLVSRDPRNGIENVGVITYRPLRTLSDAICEGLPMCYRSDIAIQCCRAVAALHTAGYLHRDLNPSVFFCEDNKILLSSPKHAIYAYNRERTIIGSVPVGDVLYSAPELGLIPITYSKASDVWSLGLTLLNIFSSRLYVSTDIRQQMKYFDDVLSEVWEKRIKNMLLPSPRDRALFCFKERHTTAGPWNSETDEMHQYVVGFFHNIAQSAKAYTLFLALDLVQHETGISSNLRCAACSWVACSVSEIDISHEEVANYYHVTVENMKDSISDTVVALAAAGLEIVRSPRYEMSDDYLAAADNQSHATTVKV